MASHLRGDIPELLHSIRTGLRDLGHCAELAADVTYAVHLTAETAADGSRRDGNDYDRELYCSQVRLSHLRPEPCVVMGRLHDAVVAVHSYVCRI